MPKLVWPCSVPLDKASTTPAKPLRVLGVFEQANGLPNEGVRIIGCHHAFALRCVDAAKRRGRRHHGSGNGHRLQGLVTKQSDMTRSVTSRPGASPIASITFTPATSMATPRLSAAWLGVPHARSSSLVLVVAMHAYTKHVPCYALGDFDESPSDTRSCRVPMAEVDPP